MNEHHTRWDATAARLIAYAQATDYAALSATVVHEAKRRIIDTFASALGAYEEPASVMARRVAGRCRSDLSATIWGSGAAVAPEMAAFANGVMTRVLDVSDTYLGASRGHPSDMTAGLVAVAESEARDGRSLIAAVVLAYDVYCSFCKSAAINAKGWDQPVYTVLGCALGAARLMALSADGVGHALSLALTPNMALAQTRRGGLSSWKGCAGANAARNAVFAAMLAREGFTGPAEVFEGEGGLWQAIGRYDWPLPDAPMIGATHTKSLPVCYHGQSAILAALELRARLDVGAIEQIRAEVYDTAVMMMGGDASRWAPETRETADHSLPYCIAIALLDGKVTHDAFSPARLADPAVAAIMRKVKVTEDAALTAQYPEGAPGRIVIEMKTGERHVAEVRYPRGHEKNPMSDAEIDAKFRELAGHRLGKSACDRALDALWRLDEASAVADVTALLAAGGARQAAGRTQAHATADARK